MEVMRDAKTASAISSKFLPPIEGSTFVWHLSTSISIYWSGHCKVKCTPIHQRKKPHKFIVLSKTAPDEPRHKTKVSATKNPQSTIYSWYIDIILHVYIVHTFTFIPLREWYSAKTGSYYMTPIVHTRHSRNCLLIIQLVVSNVSNCLFLQPKWETIRDSYIRSWTCNWVREVFGIWVTCICDVGNWYLVFG